MRKNIFAIIFSLLSFSLFAETLTFPVKGLVTVSPLPVFISAEWEDEWISEGTSFNYNHGIARIASVLASVSFTDTEDNPKLSLVKQCYKILGADENSIYFHYNVDYSSQPLGDNQSAFTFALKKIKSKNGNKTLVFIVIRGTPLNDVNEWISNIAISDATRENQTIHEGFYKTMLQIHDELGYYLLKNKVNLDEACFLITGHSRGASIANLLGAKFADENDFDTSKIFVYTFASPNVSQAKNLSDKKYGFIWNIVNGEDIVPTLPPNKNGWKFGKYGNTRVILTRWSTDKKKYDEEFYPKMNAIYSKFMIRNYCPFKNGNFIQSQITRVITGIYPDVESYYSGKFKPRKSTEKILRDVFPDSLRQSPEQKEIKNHKLEFFENIKSKINKKTDGGADYVMNAIFDMHAGESYLSWLFALDEDELFSDLGSVQLVLDGYYECAVFDLNGNLLARIIDGVPQYENIKVPIAAMPLPAKKTVVGFPLNEEFDVVIYKPSLIPTKIKAQIEFYDAQGHFIKKTEKQNFYPRIGMGLTFKAGKILQDDEKITEEKIKGKILKEKIKAGKLNQENVFRFKPEFSIDVDKNLSAGLDFGTKEIYGIALFSGKSGHFDDFLSVSGGIGHQNALYGNLMISSEFFGKCAWIFNDKKFSADDFDKEKFNFIPEARFLISFQPVHHFEFFAAGVFDFEIDDLNESYFDSKIQSNKIPKINLGDSIKIIPTISFGVKF